jgi:chemosensory pili system protein ChpA (sensor histidine kinase/response regulator)
MTYVTNEAGVLSTTRPGLSVALDALTEVTARRHATADPSADMHSLEQYLELLVRFSDLAGELDYVGLQSACLVHQESIKTLLNHDKPLDAQLLVILEDWPRLIRNHLESPLDTTFVKAIIDHLQLPVWDNPLPADDADMIDMLLLDGQQTADLLGESQQVEVVTKDSEMAEAIAVDALPPGGKTDPTIALEQRPALSVSPQMLEMLEMLKDEIPLMDEPLMRLLEIEPEQSTEEWDAAVEVYDDYLERFGEAAETIGLQGLQQAVVLMRENLGLLAGQQRTLTLEEKDLLAAWSGNALLYLSDLTGVAACHALVEWLQASDWPMPLPAEKTASLQALLMTPELPAVDEEDEEPPRQQLATEEDIRVELPDDANPDLLSALLQELPNQTSTFSESIQNLINGGSIEDVQIAQRMAHTLKGAANTVGVTGLPTLTHHLEDILVALAKQQRLPTHSLALSLMNAADCLETMGEALCGLGDPPDNARGVLQEVLDWANRIDREGLPTETDEAPSLPLEGQAIQTRPDAPAAEARQDSPQQNRAAAPKMQVMTGLIDDLLRLGGENIILSGQVHEQVRRIEQRIRTMQSEFERMQQLGGELERLIDLRDLSTDRQQAQESPVFDSLEMDQYNELHTASRMLVETATDARQMGSMVTNELQQLDKMLLTQEHLNRETQETMLSARMVPIKTVVPRLQRSVRQTCRLTGKQVELHINGIDTLMDGEVLNRLIDPLMHVLRNAVDHGIESADQRSVAGKPAGGSIWLDFVREGNNILVRCRDDGAGFDFEAIRRAAEHRGLLEPGQEISDEALTNMLLMPNFSTRSEVTQTSGRGVGLDIVYSHIVSQGGSLTLKTETGKGSTAELRLPVSLISTHAVLVRVRNQVVAVADRGIERILHADDGKQSVLGGEFTLWVNDQMYPLKYLDDILP